ncbi:MAG: response regulator [Verrucomicrobia bacterium]|nr:response regulator [Verrucomicrobiota bacterium]
MNLSTIPPNRRILVIDDNRSIHDDFRKVLGKNNRGASALNASEAILFGEPGDLAGQVCFEMDSASQGQDGLELVRKAIQEGRPYALAFVDVRMPPGWDGIETISRIWEVDPDIQVVICTAFSDYSLCAINEKIGHSDRMLILKKPFDPVEVLQLANALTEKWRLLQENKRRMDGLEENVREQSLLLDQAAEAMSLRDMDERILYWNKGAETLYGWTKEEVIGKSAAEFFCKTPMTELAEANHKLIEQGRWSGELRAVAKDGRQMTVESRWTLMRDEQGMPKSKFVISMDVTEKKLLEAQALRSQRMASIGTLAGGIAHDLNNVLTPIMMSLQLLKQRLPDESSQQLLATLASSAHRGADIVKQVLSFARGIEGKRVEVQIKHVLLDVEKILAHTLPKSIEIARRVPNDLWMLSADVTQLHQVVMNLCVNARDAMPNGGRLTLMAENVFVDENTARQFHGAKPGRHVCVSIEDTGLGIPSQFIEKIFDPFFTTKEVGKGTGLGLSTVIGIVKSHGGFVNVHSEVGKGSCFKVYLPSNVKSASKILRQATEQAPIGHGETILLVDDEVFVLEIARGTLESCGYRVLTARDGTEALTQYAQHRELIAVVLMDLMMPYMDGVSAIRALRKMNPNLRIIASSGMAKNGNDDGTLRDPSLNIQVFLQKPYSAEKLLVTLNRVLKAG